MIAPHRRSALVNDTNSRQNKLWLVASWRQECFIELRWTGAEHRSRLEFRFEPDGEWVAARSYDDDDVRPTLRYGRECSNTKE